MSSSAMSVEAAETMKAGQRAMWDAGDYPDIAQTVEGCAVALVEVTGFGGSDRVLDVACGSGNVALAAARAGAEVVGLDLTPKLLAEAEPRASAAGFTIEWIEGDAEALSVDDASFDAVLSCFGAMFAPRQELAATELVRACRPGGCVGVTAWTPEGLNGRMFGVMAPHLPPPPEGFVPPIAWGMEDHVRELFAPHDVELSFERRMNRVAWVSVEAFVAYAERVLGPIVLAKGALEPEGRWAPLRSELVGLYADENLADDGSLLMDQEYLITTARKAAG